MMININKLIPEVKKFAIENLPKDILHGLPHIERVLKYALLVNKEVDADWNIIQCSVLLHDIGHKINRTKHNVISAEMAEKFLLSKKIDHNTIKKITDCILYHSRQYAEKKPESLEAKVLYDADGMDLFGSIGLMRALLSCALKNKDFDCMIKKLEWRINEIPNFYSNTAKKFVETNSKIIKNYLKELKEQLLLF
ncbi:MAG: HD domain-containing protein [Candidatus Hodarchaeota archaeon]